jgi:hypothetical protein
VIHDGRIDEAIVLLRRARAVNPLEPGIPNALGLALLYKRDFPMAIAMFNEALRLDSNYVEALNNRGVAYMETSRLDDAEKDFRTVTGAMAPATEKRSAYYNLGMIHNRRQEWMEAEAEFTAEETNVSDKSATLSPTGLEGDNPIKKKYDGAPALVASIGADVPGYKPDQEITGVREVAKALIAKKSRLRGSTEGADVYDIVASIFGEYPADRILGDDAIRNSDLIDGATSTEAIVASGGICNQLTPYYPLITLGDVDRPVRDALPTFKADRGGIRYNGAPTLADITVATTDIGTTGAIRITTEDADSNGYDYDAEDAPDDASPKPCLHVSCKPEATAIVDAISRCLKFGNFGSRTYPEQVEAWTKLSMVQWARVAEQKPSRRPSPTRSSTAQPVRS